MEKGEDFGLRKGDNKQNKREGRKDKREREREEDKKGGPDSKNAQIKGREDNQRESKGIKGTAISIRFL